MASPEPLRIAVLEGDQTGQELLEQALRVLAPDVTGIECELHRFDLSLENRRRTSNVVVSEAAAAMRESRLGIKAATVTPEGKDDVGSPNRILREELDGRVIIRTGRRIPGGRRLRGRAGREEVDGDEVAWRTERISRSASHAACARPRRSTHSAPPSA